MSTILTDKLIYLHKGFLKYEWRESTFVLQSNGVLCKLKDNSNNKVKKAIDLKCVVNAIKTKPADIMTNQSNNNNTASNSATSKLLSQLNIFGLRRRHYHSKILNSIVDCDSSRMPGGKEAMLMTIPVKNGSRRKLVFLFPDTLKLEEWQRNINKWASLPRIEIDFISLKDYKGYTEILSCPTLGDIDDKSTDPVAAPTAEENYSNNNNNNDTDWQSVSSSTRSKLIQISKV